VSAWTGGLLGSLRQLAIAVKHARKLLMALSGESDPPALARAFDLWRDMAALSIAVADCSANVEAMAMAPCTRPILPGRPDVEELAQFGCLNEGGTVPIVRSLGNGC
jgi:hypothetical protein